MITQTVNVAQSDFLVNIDLISVVDTDAHTDFLCKERLF